MSRRDWLVAVGLVLCTVGVVACGGSSGDGGDKPSAEEARLKFAECMREHGVNVPDPGRGGAIQLSQSSGGPRGKVAAGPGGVLADPASRKAMKSCGKYLEEAGPRNVSPQQQQEFQQQALEFAQCMRSHGIDMPDPKFGPGGKVTMTVKRPSSSPAMQAAQEACKDKQPKPPGAPAGGGATFRAGP